jgi:ribosomal-protein-alanine N-acetyltransferase
MSDGLSIATAGRHDLDAIHRIELSAFSSPWRREFFESELDAAGRFSLVARSGDALVGYLFAMYWFDEMHINKIAVDPEHRRKGIALALMERCFAFAREYNVATISLEVRQSNRGAQDFYRHIDFSPSYVRPAYYPEGEAAVVMMRQL